MTVPGSAASAAKLAPHLQGHANALEEDRFEEFEQEDWQSSQAVGVSDPALWNSAWDDDRLDDDFSAQLREQQRTAAAQIAQKAQQAKTS